jgi:hypothetical protein
MLKANVARHSYGVRRCTESLCLEIDADYALPATHLL